MTSGKYERGTAVAVAMEKQTHEALKEMLRRAVRTSNAVTKAINARLDGGANAFGRVDAGEGKPTVKWPVSIKGEYVRLARVELRKTGVDENGPLGVAILNAVGKACDAAKPDVVYGLHAKCAAPDGQDYPECFTVRLASGALYGAPPALLGPTLALRGIGLFAPSGPLALDCAYLEAAHWDGTWRLRAVKYEGPKRNDPFGERGE